MNDTIGVKKDSGKAKWTLLPMLALSAVVDVLTFGAVKYSPDNWRYVDDAETRYADAAFRHIVAWVKGEKIDPESGLPHLSHAICCLLFLSEFDAEEDEDNEPIPLVPTKLKKSGEGSWTFLVNGKTWPSQKVEVMTGGRIESEIDTVKPPSSDHAPPTQRSEREIPRPGRAVKCGDRIRIGSIANTGQWVIATADQDAVKCAVFYARVGWEHEDGTPIAP